MNLEKLFILILILIILLNKKLKINFFLLKIIVDLRVNSNTSYLGLSWYYVIILCFMNLIILLIDSKLLLLLLLYCFFFFYKFIIYNIYLYVKFYKINLKFTFMILFCLFYCNNFIIKLYLILLVIDLIICINNCNNQYDLAFMGFSEEFFEISLTEKGKFKIYNYFRELVFENNYIYEDLKDHFFYQNDFDFFYKNYNDNFK